MFYKNNKGILGMSNEKKEPSIYDLASKGYDQFMEWAETTFEEELKAEFGEKIGRPSGDYILKKYDEYLERNNIDEYGNPLPSPNEP